MQVHIDSILFPTDTAPEAPKDTTVSDEVEFVSFRGLVPEIKDTGYLTHAIFAYPAKFIPQVVRYAINTYTKEGDWIVDPFAGSGTVGVSCSGVKSHQIYTNVVKSNHIYTM